MRRPLLELTLILWGIILTLDKVPIQWVRLIYILVIILYCIWIRVRTWNPTSVLLGVCILLVTLCVELHVTELHQTKQPIDPVKEVVATGIVTEISKYNTVLMDVEVLNAKINGLTGQNINIHKVLLQPKWGENQDWQLGDKLQVTGTIERFERERNPNTFSPLNYYKSKGIDYKLSGNRIVKSHVAYSKLYALVGTIQNQLTERLYKLYTIPDASLLEGLLLGSTSEVDKETLQNFRASGTAHVMALSGLHFGILYMMIFKMLCWLKFSYRKASSISLMLMLLFVFVSGLSFSAIRAFAMAGLYTLSVRLERKYDLLNALGTVALCSIVLNTYVVWNVGFQLSFWAVFTIGAYGQYKGRLIKHSDLELLELPIIIYMTLLPLTLFHFNQWNIYSVLFNVPVAVLMPITFIQSIIGILVGDLPIIGESVIFMSSALVESLRAFTALVVRLPYGILKTGSPSGWTVVLFYVVTSTFILSYTLREWSKSIHRGNRLLCYALAVGLLILVWSPSYSNHLTIDFLDVGQGDSALVRTPSGENILIDAGPEKADLEDILLKQGINKLDAMFISHLDADHYFGATEIADSIKVKTIYHAHVENKVDVLENLKHLYPNTEIIQLGKGDRVQFGSVHIKVLHPERERVQISEGEISSNDLSLVLALEYLGKKVLFTGDIEENVERQIASENKKHIKPLDVDILKVAHHGSSTSTDPTFIEAFNPEIGIIQVGKNFFGHPTQQTLKTLSLEGIKVFRNDDQGCVRVLIKNDGIEVIPWLTIGP